MGVKFSKYIMYIFCLSFIFLTLESCGSNKAPSAANSIELQDLVTRISANAGTLPEMSSYSKSDEDAQDWFEYLCDLDYTKVDNFYISYATEGSSEELFIIQLKDENDVNEAVTALKNRITSRTSTFEMYMPEEVSKLNSAVVVSYRNYVALLICPDISNAKTTFETVLSTTLEK